MTIYTQTSAGTQSSDAEYNARINEFFGALEATLVHVPQAGEAVYPAVGAVRVTPTFYGWRMYRLPGALHASAPVYIKAWYGCATSTSAPAISIQVGTAVDGSGVFVGVAATTYGLNNSNATTPSAGNFITYACSTDDGFHLIWKAGGISTGRAVAAFFCYRSSDASGQPSTVGVFYGRPTSSTNSLLASGDCKFLRFASPNIEYSLGSGNSWIPGGGSASGGLSGEIEAYLNFYRDPLVRPTHCMCAVWSAEFPAGTTFAATLVGSTPRTYISHVSAGLSTGDPLRVGSFAFLWE